MIPHFFTPECVVAACMFSRLTVFLPNSFFSISVFAADLEERCVPVQVQQGVTPDACEGLWSQLREPCAD